MILPADSKGLSRRRACGAVFGLAAGLSTSVARAALPEDAVAVRQFGARGDGRSDDTAAIQRACDALAPGQWLVFEPGIYLHAMRLVLARRGVTLFGHGATLHATNADDQALLIQADGVRVIGFTMTALTDRRRDAPWQSRIAVWRHGEDLPALVDIDIRDNRIVDSGPAGSARANSSSSAAIFVHNARRFVIAGNTVRRSLADAIHVTGGARAGRIVGNTVRESGDDMVAIVSYLGRGVAGAEPPAQMASDLARRRRTQLVRDVVIADNDLAGQYWGRGISVVGGEDITIVGNTIDATTHAAGIYIACETSYSTFGVRNVLIAGNRITRVQTTSPAYSVLDAERRGKRTGHAAVEIVAHVYEDEARHAELRDALTIRSVAVEDNVIEDVAGAGIRIGDGWGERGVEGGRAYRGAAIHAIALRGNRMGALRGKPIEVLNAADPALELECAANTVDGRPTMSPACGTARLDIKGSTQARAVPPALR